MKTIYVLPVLVSLASGLVFATGCSNQSETAVGQPSLVPENKVGDEVIPGIHDKSFVASSGNNVRYTIAIPNTYDESRPTTLVVALHFGGQVTPHYARGFVESLVLPGLSELNAIIVAPDSIAGRWNNDKNEQAVLELMDYVSENYNIDQSKTILTGFSMGGYGTWYIGGRNQDRFCALIPIAGGPVADAEIDWTTPIYVIHSKADEVVPIGPTEKFVTAQKDAGNENIVFVVVDDLPHFQTPRFADPLRDAVPWIKKIWAESQ